MSRDRFAPIHRDIMRDIKLLDEKPKPLAPFCYKGRSGRLLRTDGSVEPLLCRCVECTKGRYDAVQS